MRNRSIPVLSDDDKQFVRDLVIHEDDMVLAFNKPSRLASQTRGNRGRNLDHLLWAFARSNGKRPRLVHRLDTGTSGLILAGKTQPAAAHLSNTFKNRVARKTYLAIVSGSLPDKDAGTIKATIARVTVDGRDQIVADHPDTSAAKSAQTDWRVLARGDSAAFVEVKPRTGRMHQIRVHLSHIACPILGDPIYSAGRESAPRLMLHASALSIPHPDGSELSLGAPLPADMQAMLDQHGLSYAAS